MKSSQSHPLKPRQSNETESEIQTDILDYLNRNKMFSFRINTMGVYDKTLGQYRRPSKFHMNGCSDILGIISPSGRMLAIEVKTPIGTLSKEQKAFLNKINREGGVAFCARSVIEVEEELKDLNKKRIYV